MGAENLGGGGKASLNEKLEVSRYFNVVGS